MSDNIPLEIQVEIMKRLPVKSLIQFRSVSKPWKSLIDSSKFIADYHTRRHDRRLLVRYSSSPDTFIDNCVLFVDDDSFPQHKIPMILPMSVTTKTTQRRYIITTISQGLVCFCIYDKGRNDPLTMTVVLWNPAIRKTVDIVLPVLSKNRNSTFFSFGVSPHTNDPMFVKITYTDSVYSDCLLWDVEVFTLSTGVWRSLCTNLPRKSIRFSTKHVAIDRFIYWIGVDWRYVDSGGRTRNTIMSFDMTSEAFKEISLPDCLTYLDYSMWPMLDVYKLRESLVVLETDENVEKQEHVVWIMEHDVPNSFRKLYTIKAPDASIVNFLGFRSCGESIIERASNFGEPPVTTSVYDPSSQCFNDIVIVTDNACLRSVSNYTETLLLLDR